MNGRFRFLSVNLLVAPLLSFLLICGQVAEGCTSAVWASELTADHAPLMWKNRDTDGAYNSVRLVVDSRYRYIGLGDSGDRASRGVFAGLNEAGFAIFNTVAYNLPQPESEVKDREGEIMAEVLGSIATVAEFEAYLGAHLGSQFGAQTNFVVGDASGALWVYETHNHGYEKYPVHTKAEKSAVITNFSLSGPSNTGTGYMRYDRAKSIIDGHRDAVDVGFIFKSLAKDFTNTLLRTPTLAELFATSGQTPFFYATIDTINRESTVAAAVIQAKNQDDKNSLATFWVLIGEPLTGLAVPLWIEAGAVPESLSSGHPTAMQRASLGIKSLLRPLRYPEQDKYLDLSRLVNREGSGVLPPINAVQDFIIARTREFLSHQRSSDELRSFQDGMATYALSNLQALAESVPQ